MAVWKFAIRTSVGALVPALLLAACTTQKAAPTPPVHRSPGHLPMHTPTTSANGAAAPGAVVTPSSAISNPNVLQPQAPSVSQPSRQLADGSRVPAVQALLASAQNQSNAGQLDAAAASLERAQRLAPQSALVYQRLADVRLRQQRPAEAEQLLRRALGFASGSTQQAAIWRQLAVARQKQGKVAEAQQANDRAAALEAQRP